MTAARDSAISLPIASLLPALVSALREHTAVVLQAPPGAGKTTGVPLALWRAGVLDDRQRLLMLEPRRLAARAAATTLARYLGEPVGATVGYRTRLDTRVSAQTRIEVVTEGILIRMLQEDPSLASVGMVIFDEFHERSLQADLGLALTREVQLALREDLRLLVMSATLDTGPVADLLGAAPVLTSAGRSYPVSTHYWPPGRTPWLDHVLRTLLDLAPQKDSGSILAFLPGAGEIRRLARDLEGRLPPDLLLAPLYGDLSSQAQDAAIAPAPEGQRKLVLATAIAQTSLTIEGIATVVDAGFERVPVFDPNSAMTRLVTQRVSAAAADQRQGRAGRLSAGRCYRLWSAEETLRPFSPPEITQADLSGLVLELARWGARSPDGLAWLDRPPTPAWNQALALLQSLSALTVEGALTELGGQILDTGLPPRLGYLFRVASARGQRKLGAEIAALLSERDLIGARQGADLHHRLWLLRGEAGAGAESSALHRLRSLVRRLENEAPPRVEPSLEPGPSSEQGQTRAPALGGKLNGQLGVKLNGQLDGQLDGKPGEILALGFADRVARRRPGKDPRYQLANGRGAFLDPGDPLGDAEWLVIAEMDGRARESRIFIAARITPEGIERALAERMQSHDSCDWDERAEQLVSRRERRLGVLCLHRQPLAAPNADQRLAAFLARLLAVGIEALPWSDSTRQWQARVALLRANQSADAEGRRQPQDSNSRQHPEAWPDVSDAALLASAHHWLAPYLLSCQRWSDMARLPLGDALGALLSYSQQQRLNAEAPTHIRVPTGQEIAVNYRGPAGPVLAVKLQAVFGWRASPRLAFGQVCVTLHLLSPARRPAAVTQDLASFWQQGYPQVRRELRGRYPKHPWPEDPLTAAPQQGVKRRPEKH